MKIHNHFLRAMAVFLTCSILLAFSGCDRAQKHQSPQEKAMGNYWYEAVFLEKEDVENAFLEVSDNFPKYEYVPYNFHVTTSFQPEPKHEELYGTPVTVHIIRYAYGTLQDEQEKTTSDNEGLLVEISSTDKRMQDLIDSIDKVFHITGSYTGEARFTGQLDFTAGTPIDITIEGVFGMSYKDEKFIIEQQN